MTRNDMLRAGRLVLVLVAAAVAAATAQERSAHEARREQWQRVGDILETMGVRPGSMVADIGAGDGFFTTRLATAVGPSGRVYAVDISDQALARLRRRLADDGAENVIVIKGAPDDPRLPNGTLDAALIVNAYHEMDEHQAMLAALRRALKPDGRLVIVEPISERRRGASRAEQVRSHEIAPEHVVAEARSAGFRIVSLQDPFAERDNDVEWLIVLQTGPAPGNTAPPSNVETPMSSPCSRELDDPVLRIALGDFRKLHEERAVTVVDVRDPESFARGHIPGALSIPLRSIDEARERLRELGKPIVTYCS